MDASGDTPTRTHESPSLSTGSAPTDLPATGLRLPALRSEPDALHLESDRSAGGERLQGTTDGRQAASDAPANGAPAPGASELVSEGRLEPTSVARSWTLRDDDCPLEGAYAYDRTTGEIAWRPTCKNARCRRCSRQVSAQTFALARRSLEKIDHVRFITLTQVPDGWDETRHAMKMWLRDLRRDGFDMNVLWVIEEGSETGMRHAHGVQWGDFIPKSRLDESWPYGFNEIEGARAATNYLAKGVVRYVAKGLDGDGESIEEHMNLNGGRAAHWTRGYFGGLSRDGYRKANPLPGIYFVHTEMGDRRDV